MTSPAYILYYFPILCQDLRPHGAIAPPIHAPGTRWALVARSTLQPLYPMKYLLLSVHKSG